MAKPDKLWNKALRARRKAKKKGNYNVKGKDHISLRTKDFVGKKGNISKYKSNPRVQFEGDRKTRKKDFFITIHKK